MPIKMVETRTIKVFLRSRGFVIFSGNLLFAG